MAVRLVEVVVGVDENEIFLGAAHLAALSESRMAL